MGMSLQNDGKIVKLFQPDGECFYNFFNPPESVPYVKFSSKGIFTFSEDFKQDGSR
jgi:hypothetical protein